MWPSLEAASRVFDWATAAFVASLVVGVISTILIAWMANVKESHWAELRRQSDERIAEANARGDEAKAEAGRAYEAAGNANERAAGLEKEAASARLETEKIKQVVAWRTLTPDAASELLKSLALKPGSVNLRYIDGDPEALFLAVQISHILAQAHWQVAPGAVKPANAIVFGIVLPDSGVADAQALRDAFTAAKVPFSIEALPAPGVSFSIAEIPNAPRLMIGSRTPPAFQ